MDWGPTTETTALMGDGATGDGATGGALTTTAAACGGGIHDELERGLAGVGRALDPLASRPSQRADVRKRDRMAGDAQPTALLAAADAAVPAPVKKRRKRKGSSSAACTAARR
eukprot:CAMPEP_0182603208 /NCGR_PEP_ID=MMETSP1324-20130603/92381_1 /TAXON_ID=236786 /ORGANISM="Florenciella sp., Strain RCC1587" /LENGTH=112 /DNA_ID=CAMNT_0024821137 /DNA_START=867 /DNA_END=1205 /DNA_ORIENTATION=+